MMRSRPGLAKLQMFRAGGAPRVLLETARDSAFPAAKRRVTLPLAMAKMINPPAELRSPADTVGGVVYFARMLSKIRLQQTGRLPDDLKDNLGIGFDEKCVRFLRVPYEKLRDHVRESAGNASDEELLGWCYAQGRRPEEDEIEIWNTFMRKHGWKDKAVGILERRKRESGLEGRDDLETMFQYIDADENRPVRSPQGEA